MFYTPTPLYITGISIKYKNEDFVLDLHLHKIKVALYDRVLRGY